MFLIFNLIFIIDYELMSLDSLIISFPMLFDWISLMFMSFVFFISSMVFFYSSGYMKGDLNMNRFLLLVFLFIVSMALLIISPNMISILLGWDGLGLVSYCLVIYYQNVKSFNSGMITALSNRVGDVALLISIAWMVNYGSWNFIYYLDFFKFDYSMVFISWFIVLAGFTKSAQVPFSSWLPSAMSAPTPVSSLVHSSTLVTGGVYLFIRFSDLFSSFLLSFMLFFSVFSMFMAGIGASFEYDLKKIIAFSTLSQLGMMISILTLGDINLSIFHLLIHALFKSLLFLCAGYFIHNLNGCQDIRLMGGLISFMPLICCFFCISSISLCGFPFFSGFYSKDLILEGLSLNYFNFFIYFIFYLSMGLTIAYSFRLVYFVLLKDFSFNNFFFFHDNFMMLVGMMGLFIVCIFGGSILSWLIFPTSYFICLPFIMKVMIFIFICFGLVFGSVMSKTYFGLIKIFLGLDCFYFSLFNLSNISILGVDFFLNKGEEFYKLIDQGWLEHYGSQGIYFYMNNFSNNLFVLFNNSIKIFLFLFVIMFIFFCLFFFYSLY
uniref:NADH-ubiquinone oxidoreductase chain 5 n=1 Tax=Iberobaenia minuta TaxID=1857294 RepID=A0A3G1DH71_9COLE|nr:NADH deshydrogenase subunit 5 [Iberobaenia minuta]